MKRLASLLLFVVVPAAGVHAWFAADEPMPAAARALLESLAPDQRATAVIPFDDPNRLDWHYVPRERKGIALGELSDEQRELARALLGTALSEQGRRELDGVLELEAILRRTEAWRDPGAYFLTVFGSPSGDEPWGWRIEGHHLSLNFSSVKGELSVTPAFFGANPARVVGRPHDGLRVLGREDDLAHALIASLNEEQRADAILEAAPTGDILLGPGREAGLGKPAGIAVERMDERQRELLAKLLEEYVRDFEPAVADRELARIRSDGYEKIHFAWIGDTRKDEPCYWRLHGPRFVIEFDNSRGGADHVHTVWRDLENDFGADLLRRHLEREHSGR